MSAESMKAILKPLSLVPGMQERIDKLDQTDGEDLEVKGAKTILAVIPGMGEIVDNYDRPGRTFNTDTHAGAEWSLFAVEAKALHSSSGASEENFSAGAFTRADVGLVSATAGPIKATLGLSTDTGVGISPTQVEAKILGTGVSLGRKMGISVLGTGFEFKLW